jgi:pseudaminic acid cytidylyltransferase
MNLCIIPARSGSKRIPGKNVREFAGKPIISYSVEAAKTSGLFERIVVATDSDRIGAIGSRYGAVYYKRRPENAGDGSILLDVVLEVLEYLQTQVGLYDNVCVLYPCAPFATAEHLKAGLDVLTKEKWDVVFPIVQNEHNVRQTLLLEAGRVNMMFPLWNNQNSHDWPATFRHASQWFWCDVERLYQNNSLVPPRSGYITLSRWEAEDIDTEEDWKCAEIKWRIMQERKE